MTVVRRTRVVPTRLKDRVLPTYDPYQHMDDKFIVSRHFGSAFVQGGSTTPGYFVFPKAFSSIKGASAEKIDSYDESTYPTRCSRILVGCVYVTGSPGGYVTVMAVGDM